MDEKFIYDLLDGDDLKMTESERIIYEYKQIINNPKLFSYGFGDLSSSVVEIITKHQKILCRFCLSGKNLEIKDGKLVKAFCKSCRAKLSIKFPCLKCKRSCWVNELGLAAKLCKRCFSTKVVKVGITKDGDWVCPSCSNRNYSFRKECNYCEHIRSEIVDCEHIERETKDWSCPHCDFLNFSHRLSCGKCGSEHEI